MEVAPARARPDIRSRTAALRSPALIALALGGIALLPRTLGLADFFTTDEAYHWIVRTERFSAAVAEHRWEATIQTGHPGVTLMWLGSLGLALERAAVAAGWASVTSPLEHLAWLRLPAAVLQALLVPAAYVLLRRLLAPSTAAIAALLWATSPYLIAHARLLHLDALLTAFVTFSLLLLLVATRSQTAGREAEATHTSRGRRLWLPILASGVCAGLALLTKGPALILLPYAGLVMCWLIPADRLGERVRRALLGYGLWLGAAMLVVVLLWPALWVNPERALGEYISEIVSNGGRPNGDGQFFLGRAVADPGPLFYLVADLFRMTPVTTIGLLALPFVRRRPPCVAERRVLLALGAFALFWTLVMTLGPKKFDRYVLPTWPALLVLAAAGLTRLFDALREWRTKNKEQRTENREQRTKDKEQRTKDKEQRTKDKEERRGPSAISFVLGCLCSVLLLANLAWYHPYYLSYYNPLLGGGAIAQRALLIGWGEGMDQVGAYLSAQPDIGYGPVLSALGPTLQPFVPVPVKDVTTLDAAPANYAVVYLESIQRGANPAIYARIQQTVPLHRIAIHGIEYATIYQLPKPFERAVAARFGEALHLRGISMARAPGHLIVTPSWDVRARPPGDYLVFLHLLDSAGRRVAQIDVAPGGGDAPPTSAWEPGRQIAVPLPLPLPADLPAGEYQLVMGLYDVTTGQRLALLEGPPADRARAGPEALLLTTITLP
jgi:uncharacterized membrane protein YhaH (DUF805 family)